MNDEIYSSKFYSKDYIKNSLSWDWLIHRVSRGIRGKKRPMDHSFIRALVHGNPTGAMARFNSETNADSGYSINFSPAIGRSQRGEAATKKAQKINYHINNYKVTVLVTCLFITPMIVYGLVKIATW